MKIAQVSCTYPPYAGGIGRVAFEYTERLRARGHHVHVYTPRFVSVPEDPDYVHRVPSPLHVGNAGMMPSLFYRLKGFDLIHLHYPFFGGAEPVIVRKAIRDQQGLVITYHHDASLDGWRKLVHSAHRRVLFPWLMNRADRILVSSESYAKTCELSEIPRIFDRVEIHPFGVDTDRFAPGKDEHIRRAHHIPLDVPVFIFVGGMDSAHHFKGVSVFLRALARLKQQDWHALLVGDGELRGGYEEEAKVLPCAGRIHFVGHVAAEDLPAYYRTADVHVFPSTRRAEAFGMVALEAAASGIPTIASDLPGVNSVVLDGVSGCLIPPEDTDALARALSLMLERPDVRARFGSCARERAVLKFSWGPCMDALERTYQSVFSQQAARDYPL